MSRACPKCNSSFDDRWYCPTCGVRLVAAAQAQRKTAAPKEGAKRLSSVIQHQRIKWQQTTWGKCVIGVLLAQALFYALWQLGSAVAIMAGADPNWWDTLFGLLVKQSMQAVSLLAAGMMAGAGQRRALRNGTIVGVYNGFFFLLVETVLLKHQMNLLTLLGQPLLQVAFGALGAYLGRVIWSPVMPVMPRAEGAAKADKEAAAMAGGIALPKARSKPSPFSGKVGWIRVVTGTAVVVIGCLSANAVRDDILRDRPGIPKLSVETRSQAQFVAWEISVLSMVFGGAIAGANTLNGPLQGLVVGLISTAVLIGNSIQSEWAGHEPPTETLFFTLLGIDPGVSSVLEIVLFRALSVIPLCLVGGWFGGQLLPPVIGPPRKKRVFAEPV